MEKIVKGATKIKLAAPKSKYVEPILQATNSGEAGVADVFRTLQLRLRDSTWTIVFKSLIIVHLMIREGAPDATLRYAAESPKRLAISAFTEGKSICPSSQTQGSNIRHYSDYLLERVRGYKDTKTDHVREGAGRFKRLTIDKGLLRETETVQAQIRALLKCDILGSSPDPDNEISLTAFRLLTMDLLELFKVMNEGTINVLEHYFEMSRPDAERALAIYKTFGRQTDQVVQYLSLARQYQSSTRLEVPRLKHAPTTLTSSLEDYLNDPDFEVNRRQYFAQQQAKKNGKPFASSQPSTSTTTTPSKPNTSFPAVTSMPPSASQPPKGPAPDLIDFFESIEQNQQPMAQTGEAPQFLNGMAQAQASQQPNFAPQQTGYNPFLQQQQQQQQQTLPQQPQLQPDLTGAGFGGYTPLGHSELQQPQQQHYTFQSQLGSIPQNGVADFGSPSQTPQQFSAPMPLQSQQTSSNPFRQSMMQQGQMSTTNNGPPSALSRQSTNPFARHTMPQQQQTDPNPYQANGAPSYTFPPAQAHPQDLQHNPNLFSSQTTTSPVSMPPQRTATNPFAQSRSPPPSLSNPQSPLVANPTGSTNPFRQSQFVNQQTGQGWQNGTQGTFFGVDMNQLDTRPVFPRP